MIINKQLQEIINEKLKNKGWVLMKTIKVKPMGYKGYWFTQYEKDDITETVNLKAKTPAELARKIIKTYSKI